MADLVGKVDRMLLDSVPGHDPNVDPARHANGHPTSLLTFSAAPRPAHVMKMAG